MKQNFMVVGYYTDDELYKSLYQKISSDLNNLGMCYDFQCVPRLGNWIDCAKYRPTHLLKMLEKHKMPMLSLDVDARIYKFPEVFNNIKEDLAIHYRNGHEPLCGTMFIQNNEKIKDLMEHWLESCIKCPIRSGLVFMAVLKEHNITIHKLPPQYAKIFDLMANIQNPIIEHFQASRKARKWDRKKCSIA